MGCNYKCGEFWNESIPFSSDFGSAVLQPANVSTRTYRKRGLKHRAPLNLSVVFSQKWLRLPGGVHALVVTPLCMNIRACPSTAKAMRFRKTPHPSGPIPDFRNALPVVFAARGSRGKPTRPQCGYRNPSVSDHSPLRRKIPFFSRRRRVFRSRVLVRTSQMVGVIGSHWSANSLDTV